MLRNTFNNWHDPSCLRHEGEQTSGSSSSACLNNQEKRNMRIQKAVMAAAIAAAFATPAAFADVTISGAINMGIEYVHSNDGSLSSGGTSNFGLSNNYSNVTISSVEDLGGGLKLDFAFQIQTANDTAGGNLTNRNSHIGLVGESWGGFWYGSNENIYERYFYTIDPLDGAYGLGGNLQMLGTPGGQVFANDANCNFLGVPGSADHACGWSWYRRDSNAVWYDSPNFNGFTFGAAVGLNEGRPDVPDINPWMWQIGAKYVGPAIPVQLWAAYGHRKDQFGLAGFANSSASPSISAVAPTNADGSKDTAFQLGAAYTLADITVFANFERIKYTLDGVPGGELDSWRRNAFSVGLKWVLPTGYVGAQYIQALDAKCGLSGGGSCTADSDTGAKMIAASYFHKLSKQTQGYVT